MENSVGTKMTPRQNSRIVRPREIRATKMPMKGPQAIHQIRYVRVQPALHPPRSSKGKSLKPARSTMALAARRSCCATKMDGLCGPDVGDAASDRDFRIPKKHTQTAYEKEWGRG